MRSEDQILMLVRAKADALRRRRRRLIAASGGSAAALLLVIGIAVAATTGGTNDTVVTADDEIGSADDTTTSSSPSTTASPTSTADEASPSTTTAPAEPSPERSDDPRPEGSEASPTTTTPPPPPPCPASAIEMTVTTDRSTYTPGEQVVMTAVGTNKAGRDCAEADSSETVISDHEGRQVYGMVTIAGRTEGDWRWRAGETRTNQLPWNQESVSEDGRSPVPPGTYTVTMSWTAASPDSGHRVTYAGSATFTIEEP